MSNSEACEGASAVRLIFACSGAADVGQIADLAARKLTRDGVGGMFCLAGVGGRVEPIMKKTASASRILVIDGCPLDCAKHCLQQAGVSDVEQVRVTDLGMEKGASPATDERVADVAAAATRTLG